MKLINNPLIGTDCELFLQTKRTKRFVSAEGIIKGTKREPFNFDSSNKYFATSLDNVLAEFCIPPVSNVEDWVAHIKKSRGYIESILPPRLCTVAIPSAIMEDRWIHTINASEFGCDEDYNAWTRLENEFPKADNPNLRSAGAHIHVGYDLPETKEKKKKIDEAIVRTMDLFLGVPSVLQEPENDRKKLYGKAGAFRFKEYGAEYRTISNYYLENETLTRWAFGATISALDFINEGRLEEAESVGDQIQESINTSNKVMAQTLINQFNLQLA